MSASQHSKPIVKNSTDNTTEPVFQVFQNVAIFGSADVNDSSPEYQQAYIIAQLLADTGVRIVNGGGPGVMKAATLGAQSKNGRTLTVTFAPKDAPFFEGRLSDNLPDDEIKTDNYPDRMLRLIRESDAFVILRGGTGTLSEWATAWLMAHIYYGHHKPIVLVGDFWHEVIDVVQKHFFIAEQEVAVYRIVSEPEEVIPALQELEQDLIDQKTVLS
ncbi:LOG family protein [Candidatus Woesebacteria bacterium]|nr:LOG family protein [Candidatus Woesebacteria bacterium]MCD8506981.1 LOG family protein [Candidatus Woesebacteria bacterium]MCD8527272.1 LOG family protein [Candidatus Woesebacteria bacterium]MCD8546638.1 LOG family protein [Candidatus Woesebacteria bacterium]